MRKFKKAARVAGFLLALTVFFLWQNFSLQVEQTEISLSALPAEFDGLRIAEIADLHGREFGRNNERLLAALRRAEPDLICIDGDLFDERSDLRVLAPLFAELVEIAPTFYVTGNHEFQVPERQEIFSWMEAAGVHVLRGTYIELRRGAARLIIAGIDDPCGPYDRKTPEELVREIRQRYGQEVCILMLAHRNDELAQWAALDIPLVLAGHCHGGVVRLPVVGGVFGAGRRLFPDYDAGLYREGNTALYVSRGLGGCRVKLRLFNRPHLPVLVLRSEKT